MWHRHRTEYYLAIKRNEEALTPATTWMKLLMPSEVSQSSADRHLSCVHFGAIVKYASVWMYIFISLGYTPRSRLAGPYANAMFKCLRNCQNVFQSDCIILHSHQQRQRVPMSPQPHGPLLPVLLTTAVLGGMKSDLIMVLNCIFLMADHLFTSSGLIIVFV